MMHIGAAGLALAIAFGSACRADDAPTVARGLVVHEWGTFTSFAGADGVALEFSTDPGKDLPGFVWTLDRARGLPDWLDRHTKRSRESLERMETPVIYFHTDRALDASVRVDFIAKNGRDEVARAHAVALTTPQQTVQQAKQAEEAAPPVQN